MLSGGCNVEEGGGGINLSKEGRPPLARRSLGLLINHSGPTLSAMSTLAAADPSSDDENDQDFRPAEPKSKARGAKKRRRSTSASGSSSSDSDDDQDVKVENEEAVALRMEQEAAEAEQRKRRAEAAFQAMKAGGSSSTSAATKAEVAMVTVQRARRFAGETL